VPYAEFVSSTTHKTLRGPRGGFILCKKEFAKKIDSQIFPGIQGGPLMNTVAAKAVCFNEAMQPSFKEYAKRIVENSKVLCACLKDKGFRIVSGGTDNHLFLIDLTNMEITGYEASETLASTGIILNKNVIPYDSFNPNITSGIRIGTPAVTTQGMGTEEMYKIGELIAFALKNRKDNTAIADIAARVKKLAEEFPVYPNM
jgi:glycine hydroxymethyltransferase